MPVLPMGTIQRVVHARLALTTAWYAAQSPHALPASLIILSCLALALLSAHPVAPLLVISSAKHAHQSVPLVQVQSPTVLLVLFSISNIDILVYYSAPFHYTGTNLLINAKMRFLLGLYSFLFLSHLSLLFLLCCSPKYLPRRLLLLLL